MELLQTVLINSGTVVMGNNERICIPETLRFMWELESLANLSPALLANVGVLIMSMADVGWQLMLVQWLEHRPETDKDLLTGFCDVYIYKTINYLTECTLPHMFSKPKSKMPRFKRVINHTLENMVQTFTTLLDVSCFIIYGKCSNISNTFHLFSQILCCLSVLEFIKCLSE